MPIQFDTLLKAILEIKIMKKEPTFPKLLFVLHYQVLVESSDTVRIRLNPEVNAFHQIPIAHILSHVGYLKALI